MLGRQHLRGNLPEDGGDAVFLIEEVGAVSGFSRDFVAEVDVAGFFEYFHFVFRRDLVEHRLQLVVFQRREFDAFHFAANPQNRLRA